jgi:hypothetical protein
MTDSTGSTTPPEWYTNPPAWLSNPPAHQAPYSPPNQGQSHGTNDQDLITAIRAMPEQVVSALREAIQGAQQARPPEGSTGAPAGQAASSTPAADSSTGGSTQTGTGTGTGTATGAGEEAPKTQLTFADRWFANNL